MGIPQCCALNQSLEKIATGGGLMTLSPRDSGGQFLSEVPGMVYEILGGMTLSDSDCLQLFILSILFCSCV